MFGNVLRPPNVATPMTAFTIVTALLNLALGFGLAVYLGAAPRYGTGEPSPFVRRLMSLIPFRRRT